MAGMGAISFNFFVSKNLTPTFSPLNEGALEGDCAGLCILHKQNSAIVKGNPVDEIRRGVLPLLAYRKTEGILVRHVRNQPVRLLLRLLV